MNLPTLGAAMKVWGQLLAGILGSVAALAQITFTPAQLPLDVGTAYTRAYLDSADKDVSQLVGAPGGPHRWDFAYPPTDQEVVQRLDSVAPGDGGHGTPFPPATYAERVTRESDRCQSWSYFQVIAGAGRFYYGFHDACKKPQADIVFETPTLELPAEVTYGQTWRREVDWPDVIDAGFIVLGVAIHFVNESHVDAFGTVVLPGLGELPALRVNEVNTYVTTDVTFGLPIDTQIFRNYYWLVPGLGKAVHIISPPATAVPPADFPKAKTVLRVFESNAVRPPERQPVRDLRISLKGQEAFLTWAAEPGATGYELEVASELSGSAGWTVVGTTTDRFWFDPVPRGARAKFYRVCWTR